MIPEQIFDRAPKGDGIYQIYHDSIILALDRNRAAHDVLGAASSSRDGPAAGGEDDDVLVGRTPIGVVMVASVGLCSAAVGHAADTVSVDTTDEPGLIQPLLDALTKQTGIQTRMAALMDDLTKPVDAGVTQPTRSAVLGQAIPANLRDSDGNWFTLSLRARAVHAAEKPVA